MDKVRLSAAMPDGNKCPQCATPLPTDALAGLCPKSLLKMWCGGRYSDRLQTTPVHTPICALTRSAVSLTQNLGTYPKKRHGGSLKSALETSHLYRRVEDSTARHRQRRLVHRMFGPRSKSELNRSASR